MTDEPRTVEPSDDQQVYAKWAVADWLGKVVVDGDGPLTSWQR